MFWRFFEKMEEEKYQGRGGWRGGGRPKKEKSDAVVTASLGLALRPDEKEKIIKNAEENGMSVSRYVVERCA